MQFFVMKCMSVITAVKAATLSKLVLTIKNVLLTTLAVGGHLSGCQGLHAVDRCRLSGGFAGGLI